MAHRTGFILRFFYLLAMGVLVASAAKAADWPRLPAETSGPAWPAVPVKAVARPAAKPFSFELGARYWYSVATTNFAFSNGNAFFGDPTSTIDWNDLEGHSGEIFGRIEHRPTGYFVKGLIGGGKIVGGEMIDRDFLTGGFKFSDTTSNVGGDNFKFAMMDIGFSRELPTLGLRGGAFVGYHYWTESLAAFGVRWYWLVDTEARTIEILKLGEDGHYVHAIDAARGSIDVPGCGDLTLDLDALWRELDEEIESEAPSREG